MSSQHPVGTPDGSPDGVRYRWLGLEPRFVPVADESSRGPAPSLPQFVEAARLTRAANRATARGDAFPADVRHWLQPAQDAAIRQQLLAMFPAAYIATLCGEDPPVPLEVASAARATRASGTGADVHQAQRAPDAFDGIHYTWHSGERRFLPLIDMDGTGPLPGAPEYAEAERLTAEAAKAAARGAVFPEAVSRWLPADVALQARRDLLGAFRGRRPAARGVRS